MNKLAEQQENKSTFPAIMVQRDEKLAVWFEMMDSKVAAAIHIAETFTVSDNETMEIAKAHIKATRIVKDEAKDVIKPYKDRINDIKQQILDTEKRYTLVCDKAEAILKGKINDRLDYLEKQRREEEERLRKIAEADRQKRLDTINKSLDKLLDKVDDLNEQKKALEERIEDPEITVEEAETIRERINAIEAKLGMAQSKVETKQVEIQNVASPISVSVTNQEKVQGMSSNVIWEVQEIVNPRAVLQAILDGKLSMACISFNSVKLKQAANDQVKGMRNATPNIPGVTFVARRDTRIR